MINACKTQKPEVIAVKEIPYFTFYTLNSERFTKDSFDKKRTKLILYFNSECDHCAKQAKWLRKEIDLFSDLELTFISFEEMSAIKAFRDKHDFTQPNITFLQDARLTFANKFGVGEFPSILLYSKKGKLIHKFEGETRVENIIPYMQ
ncbi:peroxiredoxin family protein [Urechidicola vernalis]|uniref:Redoxin domain-containing protein n=1 Tax=Urechidicola vernalis TaxID=3075600 RepID=A0ABU2Y6I7_9FLAO|nr:redoxin domain-containing protein [Urechidicola sp. P050]MDT0553244.1 redoxin domain-containing protein [Urechidicola sp. P050]